MSMALFQGLLNKIRPSQDIANEPTKPLTKETFTRVATTKIQPIIDLQSHRQFIEITLNDNKVQYQSLILSVDPIAGLFTLDDLFPQPSQGLKTGDKLTIHHQHNGQVLAFTVPVMSIGYSHSGPFYTLPLPEKVDYRPRRQHSRLELNQQHPITVRLQSPWRTPWFATVRNISAGGMRVTVGGNTLEQLRNGAQIPRIEFEFNEDLHFRCQAEVKSYRFIRRPYRHTEISLKFLDLPAKDKEAINDLVNSMAINRIAA